MFEFADSRGGRAACRRSRRFIYYASGRQLDAERRIVTFDYVSYDMTADNNAPASTVLAAISASAAIYYRRRHFPSMAAAVDASPKAAHVFQPRRGEFIVSASRYSRRRHDTTYDFSHESLADFATPDAERASDACRLHFFDAPPSPFAPDAFRRYAASDFRRSDDAFFATRRYIFCRSASLSSPDALSFAFATLPTPRPPPT